ncbi:MAG: hypothetical protein H6578_07720 [Chitinophagales bacterium]|nr:hypothetical protein [Chitinophagales bacterium]
MKLFKLLIVGLIFISFAKSQNIDTLPNTKTEFLKGLDDMFSATKRSDLKDLFTDFNNKVSSGKVSDAVLKNIINSSNTMLKMRGKAYPQLQQIIIGYLQLNDAELSSGEWSDFQNTMSLVMKNSKSGDTKTSLDFLDFAIQLYKSNALFYSKGKTWYLDNNNYKLAYLEGKPVVNVNPSTLKGATNGDTLTVYNTSGVYDVLSNKWTGNSGKVTWEKSGLPASDVFATFGKYEIDMSTQEFTVPEANFTYKNYFDKVIVGRLEDKVVAATTTETARFPRFTATRENVPPQRISDNVTYYGSFTLAGSKIMTKSDDELSELVITKPNSKEKILTAYTSSITMDLPEKISSKNAKISMFFGTDSIYHPSIDFTYSLAKNEVKLTKGDGSLAQSSFLDSYHNVDFDVDVITWNLGTDKMDLRTITTSGIKTATIESKEYFSKEKMRDLRGNVNYDPLSILRVKAAQGFDNEVHADLFAKEIAPNLTVQQIKPLLFSLVQEGFITFDEKKEIIHVEPKVEHYVLSNAEKKDFDNITIRSNSKDYNATIDLKDKSLALSGVKSVPISLATSTFFFPDSQKVVIEKNRNMLFDGLMFCGRMDAFGRDNHFNYTDFTVDLPTVDTLILNIPDGDKLDAEGKPILRPINSVLQDLKGKFTINLPINKSGVSELPQFPMFESFEPAKVYYESKDIMDGTYKKDKFYYEINPFKMDSLMYLSIPMIKFGGTFYSSDILEPIKQPLSVQPDLSLGFELTSPDEGFALYKGKGKFVSDIKLTNSGLEGKGDISYQTANFFSDKIYFYPDSMKAVAQDFKLKESSGAYESPEINSYGNNVKWTPYQDHMIAYSVDDQPFKMYDEKVKLDGAIELTNRGVSGSGIADWDEAELISSNFKLKSKELNADTASLQIKSIEGDKVTFNTPNVSAYVNFEENTGEFKSNTNDNRTEFNYNEYVTTIDEFFWDIDKKILEFSVPEGAPPAPFISLRPEQDTLMFLTTKATYSLESSVIDATGVTEILVADSRVIPGDGKVSVLPEAKMQPLTNATIEASAESKKHIIKNVDIEIFGKNKVSGSGNYMYNTKNTPEQSIRMNNIEVVKLDSSEKKKDTKEFYALHGAGVIDKSENFIVYPNTEYYGKIDMISSNESLKTDGFAKIDFKNIYVPTNFFSVKGEVNAENLGLTVEGAKDPSGKLVRTGIFINKSGIEPLYTNILNSQVGPLDKPLIETKGIVIHDDKNNVYTFGDKDVLNATEVVKGNTLKFSPTDNAVEAEGSLDLGLDMNAFSSRASGKVNSSLDKSDYTLNATIALPLGFDKTVLEKMGYYLFEDNFDMNDVDYSTAEIQKQWAELLDDKSFKKMQQEVYDKGIFEKPKSLKETIVFTDVDLYYSQTERLFRSKGKFGLAFVGDRGVHKMINGYLEFGHRLGSDFINIYLKTSFNDNIYITFTVSVAEVSSSFDDLVTMINALKTEQRTIKGENNKMYTYIGTGNAKARSFIERMKILESGGTLPPPEPPKEKPVETTPPSETPNDGNTNEETVPPTPNENVEQDNNGGVPKEVLEYEEGGKKGKKKKE